MDYPGIDGFLGTRASLVVDLIVVGMLILLPVMGWSIYQVKFKRRYRLHKRVQTALGAILGVAIVSFEIDIRMVSDWRARSADSPYYSGNWLTGWVAWSLNVHLIFAVTSALAWVFVIVQALRNIPSPPVPCPYSRTHMFWARLAAVDLGLTTLSGCIFYWLAFAA